MCPILGKDFNSTKVLRSKKQIKKTSMHVDVVTKIIENTFQHTMLLKMQTH